jgi:hypothetical protein
MPDRLAPAKAMLVAVSDDELLAEVKRTLPHIGTATLRYGIEVFQAVCRQNRIVLLRATADDYCIISERDAIGWSDDRP